MASRKKVDSGRSDTLLKDKEQQQKEDAKQYAQLLDVLTTQGARLFDAISEIYGFSTAISRVTFYRQLAQYFTQKADSIADGSDSPIVEQEQPAETGKEAVVQDASPDTEKDEASGDDGGENPYLKLVK